VSIPQYSYFQGKIIYFSLILYAGVALGILLLKSTSQFDEEGLMLLNILLGLVTLPIVFLDTTVL